MRRLLLAADEDDAYAWMARHPDKHPTVFPLWHGRYHKLSEASPFDRMATTAAVYRLLVRSDPDDWPWLLLDHPNVRACLTKVKGPDGLTPGQRLSAEQVGTRLRGAS